MAESKAPSVGGLFHAELVNGIGRAARPRGTPSTIAPPAQEMVCEPGDHPLNRGRAMASASQDS